MSAIDVFILVYLLVALLWQLPGWGLWGRIFEPLAPAVHFFGLDQYWGMFAPDPATSDRELTAILELPSGGALAWELPRLHTLSRWAAFLAFRYRSYEHSILYDGDDEGAPACREALCEYLLEKHASGDDRPKTVALVYLDRSLAPPGEEEPAEGPTRAVFFRHRPPESAR